MSNCKHGKRKSRCKECGGSELCIHDKIKYNCKDCFGSLFCEHGKRKPQCKECGGCSICVHDIRKSYCKICNGTEICIHDKRKSRCIECNGSELCKHKRYKSTCKECDGGSICIHDKIRSACKECHGGSICKHNKRRTECKDCDGSQICIHQKQKAKCKICHGSQICKHNNIKCQCVDCEGASICIHNIIKRRCKTCDGKDLCKTPLCEVRKSSKYEGYCFRCFAEEFPDKPISRNYKTKEREIIQFVKKEFPNYSWRYDRIIQDSCSKKRPDIFLDLGYQIIIIEIDENQHKTSNYNTACEHKRIMKLSQDVGERSIIFIRFNPDNYIKNKIKIASCWAEDEKHVLLIKNKEEWLKRLDVLKNEIIYWCDQDNKSSKTIEIKYLFFDDD